MVIAKITEILLSIVCLWIISTNTASAYIDPGTGSYVLQIVAAGLLAAVFVIKSFWSRIIQGFAKLFGKKP